MNLNPRFSIKVTIIKNASRYKSDTAHVQSLPLVFIGSMLMLKEQKLSALQKKIEIVSVFGRGSERRVFVYVQSLKTTQLVFECPGKTYMYMMML